MKRPLVGIVVFFILGIACTGFFPVPCAVLFVPASACCILACLSLRTRFLGAACLWLSIFLLGMLLMRQYSVLPQNHIVRIKRYMPNRIYEVKGSIKEVLEFNQGKTSFTLHAEEIATKHLRWKCCGDIHVLIKGTMDLSCGQRVTLAGTLSRPWGKYFRGRKIYLAMRVQSGDFVTKQGFAKKTIIRRTICRLKATIERILSERLSPISAGILAAMVLGEQKNVPQIMYRAMMNTGTVHILVVSGFNVGIVCFIIVLLLKILRFPRRARFFLCALLLSVYCLLTGASTPVVRATIMAITFLLAYFFKRQEDIYNALCCAALIILSGNPRNIFDIGFQLSFSSVLSIAFFYPRLKNLVKLDGCRYKTARAVAEGALVSASAWLGTAGFIVYHFRMVSPVTVLANLFIVPLATLITLSGLSLIAAEWLSPYLASSFVPAIEFFVSLLLRINAFMANLPGASFRLPQ